MLANVLLAGIPWEQFTDKVC